MVKSKKVIFVGVIIIFILIISTIFIVVTYTKPIATDQKNITAAKTTTALFFCDNAKTIQASFYNSSDNFVELILSDDRTMHVPQAISASGARYATKNEAFVFWNKGETAFIEEEGVLTFTNCSVNNKIQMATTTLANPASLNCKQQGGQTQIASRPDGGQYGLCYFEDNRACEEWAMMRGDCPIGGMRTTGYDTEAQKFCAWGGGQTITELGASCTFKDGSTCLNDDFYAGTCQPGKNK